jgi:nitric oxide synthase-interacting protein
MPRHARNCTAGSVYTYHEKVKDAQQSGYGTQALRLGKDSIKEFDCCCLTLQPCQDPLITPDGYIFEKEAILEYIVHQKTENARRMKEYEKQKTKIQKEGLTSEKAQKEANLKAFLDKQKLSTKHEKPGSDANSISNVNNDRDKTLPSFWIPSLTPQSKPTELKKPDEKVRCPMSGKPLRYKDLIPIKFTPINDRDNRSVITKDARFVCAVSNDVLGNSVPCVVLKTSGNVVTLECFEKVIKTDMIDPTNGKQLTAKDVIPLQRGATGFAGAGLTLEARKDGAVMQA